MSKFTFIILALEKCVGVYLLGEKSGGQEPYVVIESKPGVLPQKRAPVSYVSNDGGSFLIQISIDCTHDTPKFLAISSLSFIQVCISLLQLYMG